MANLIDQVLWQLRVRGDAVVEGVDLLVRNREDLLVAALFVFHHQHANRHTADNGTWRQLVAAYDQHVYWVAVVRQGVWHEAVVARVEHRREQDTVNKDSTAFLVHFVFHCGVRRYFDYDVDVDRWVFATGDFGQIHDHSSLTDW